MKMSWALMRVKNRIPGEKEGGGHQACVVRLIESTVVLSEAGGGGLFWLKDGLLQELGFSNPGAPVLRPCVRETSTLSTRSQRLHGLQRPEPGDWPFSWPYSSSVAISQERFGSKPQAAF